MVRLKVADNEYSQSVALKFQFRYGTIKRTEIFLLCQNVNWFQFRYGTIKRYIQLKNQKPYTMFQFRYGTIKRLCYYEIQKN